MFSNNITRGVLYVGETPKGMHVSVIRIIYRDNKPTGYNFVMAGTAVGGNSFGYHLRDKRESARERKVIGEFFEQIDAENYESTLVSNGGFDDGEPLMAPCIGEFLTLK